MDFCIDAEQLRKVLADIESAKKMVLYIVSQSLDFRKPVLCLTKIEQFIAT